MRVNTRKIRFSIKGFLDNYVFTGRITGIVNKEIQIVPDPDIKWIPTGSCEVKLYMPKEQYLELVREEALQCLTS